MAIKSDDIGRHVVVLGMNHVSSRTELRDRLLFSGEKLAAALRMIAKEERILESFILSTCNRVEVYAVVADPAAARGWLLRFFSDFHGIPVADFEPHLYFYECYRAAEHFFAVISSLDSLVIGEYQILGQFKEAYRLARDMGNTGTLLNKLFHFGVETGKRVRTETRISDGVLSISSAAVDLAKKILGDLKTRTALIIGAGEMSELSAKNLASAGIKQMYFANRTIENAITMAEKFNGKALLLRERATVMPHCDIIISSTGSPDYVILPDEIKKVMAERKNRALFLIDIAAPRDIHPDAGRIRNVFLYSIDDLSQVVAENAQARAAEIGKAREILTEDLEKYYDWYRCLRVVPTLVALRQQFEKLKDEELEHYGSRINALPPEQRELLRQFASSLTKKFLSHPSKMIKEVASDIDVCSFTKSVALLFDLAVTAEKSGDAAECGPDRSVEQK
jgi:glutamyl-tRNA reductase